MIRRLSLLLIPALLLLTSVAFAGDFVIVPGQRIGTVTLGMDCTSVHTLLRRPSITRMAHGIVIETWLGHQLLTTDPSGLKGLKHDYLTVFFKRGHAIQIEVSAAKFKTANSLSTRSLGADFAKRYPDYQTPHFAADDTIHWRGDHFSESVFEPGASSPAAKHFVDYGDAVDQGITWKAGAWGDLAPEADPNGSLEAIIVHVPSKRVLLNPNDGRPYSGTGPARTY